jgi:hypothetical protein
MINKFKNLKGKKKWLVITLTILSASAVALKPEIANELNTLVDVLVALIVNT